MRNGTFEKRTFDRESVAEQAAQIVADVLEALSPRLSEVAPPITGTPLENYKTLLRFVAGPDLQAALRRLQLRPVRPAVSHV